MERRRRRGVVSIDMVSGNSDIDDCEKIQLMKVEAGSSCLRAKTRC